VTEQHGPAPLVSAPTRTRNLPTAFEEQPMPDTTNDLPTRLEAVLTERFTELGNQFAEMRRHEQGPDGWPASHPVGPHHVAEVLRELLAAAPAAVPSAPADRAAIYREVADRLAADAEQGEKEGFTRIYRRSAAKQVRGWAGEAQQPEPARLTPCTCRQAIHKQEHRTPVAGCSWCTATAEQDAAVSQPDGEA